MAPAPIEADDDLLNLVHRGWDHLRLQRPLAAWACWQRALRLNPENVAATEALDRLSTAPDLPALARSALAFQNPRDPARRSRWDKALRGRDVSDLEVAAAAFGELAGGRDAQAAYNQALCFAWLGRNLDAIDALDVVVQLLADADFAFATHAWALSDLLRQGAGAEDVADDLNYAVQVVGPIDSDEVLEFAAEHGAARLVRTPGAAEIGVAGTGETRVFEWLDRPFGEDLHAATGVEDIPRLLAMGVASSGSLRFSSPEPLGLDEAIEALDEVGMFAGCDVERSATPLQLTLLDAAVWSFRLPEGLEAEHRGPLYRAEVEHYYESIWIRRARHGLDGLTPLEASRRAVGGDATLRAKLAGVILMREQLGDRPRTAALYQGYPFDRLRRRLSVPLRDPTAVEGADESCLGPEELDALDPATLEVARLADAFASAEALRDDIRSARFADEVLLRPASIAAGASLQAAAATLVRLALAADDPDLALDQIDRAIAVDAAEQGGRMFKVLTIWKAEVYARSGEPEAASRVYSEVLEADPNDVATAVDGAETLIDNDEEEAARTLLDIAILRATKSGQPELGQRAQRLLELLDASPT
ncbi:hypothetical protein EP7_004182 [Isosphaeraceae bacterium EP7]